MNRRRLCFELTAMAACALAARVLAQTAALASSGQSAARSTSLSDDDYAVWSRLFGLPCRTKGGCGHVHGYLIAQKTEIPDGLPALPTHASVPPILRAEYLSQHPDEYYETTVPVEWQAAFVEAATEAKRQEKRTVLLERRFTFNKRYRLLSEAEVDEYFSLTPAVAPGGWRPDPEIVRKYKGFDGITSLSLPSYDRARRLAVVWSSSSGGGCGISQWNFFTCTDDQWRRQSWPSMVREACA